MCSARPIEALRKMMLQAFFAHVVLRLPSQCPINAMLWDWLCSFYPDNELSPAR